MQRTCLFPGTFDPITKGHVDIIERAVSRSPTRPKKAVLVRKLTCGISKANDIGAASLIISLLVTDNFTKIETESV